MDQSFHLKQIGVFKNDAQSDRRSVARQPVFGHPNHGVLEFNKSSEMAQALSSIEVGMRLWLLFIFHKNQGFKPMTQPPVGASQRVGVLGTRSPYRPNPIGLTCVEVLQILSSNQIVVGANDLLDGTPILDIKPYIAEVDSYPDQKAPSWRVSEQVFSFQLSSLFQQQVDYLRPFLTEDLAAICQLQLQYDPLNLKKLKRIRQSSENGSEAHAVFVLAYRTWRFFYHVETELNLVVVKSLGSGYSLAELVDDEQDPYLDKEVHRQFLAKFT